MCVTQEDKYTSNSFTNIFTGSKSTTGNLVNLFLLLAVTSVVLSKAQWA